MSTTRSARQAVIMVVTVLLLTVSLPAAPAPTSAASTSTAHQSRVVYAGTGRAVHRASGELGRLSQTGPAFRRFVRKQLNKIWIGLGREQACAQAPVVVVKEYRRRVAFIANQGQFPGGPGDAPDSCAGGGAFRFYVKRNGQWRAPVAIGGQETLACKRLLRWRIPRMNGARECFDGSDVVPYRP